MYCTTRHALKRSIIPDKWASTINSISRLVPNARMALSNLSMFKVKKGEGIYACTYPGCDYTAESGMGLTMHVKSKHKDGLPAVIVDGELLLHASFCEVLVIPFQ